MRRSDLAARLAAIPAPPVPRPELEQYRTPDEVAADLLLAAHGDGAIAHKRVLDLGCGTGVFTVGAALLGATLATGVDVDATLLEAARQASEDAGVGKRTWFIAADVTSWRSDPDGFDTVVMNPPFGAQAGGRHADRAFLSRAAQAIAPTAGVAYFLAQTRTEPFLESFAAGLGMAVERVAQWDYPLQATMAHHRETARVVHVGGYRMAAASR